MFNTCILSLLLVLFLAFQCAADESVMHRPDLVAHTSLQDTMDKTQAGDFLSLSLREFIELVRVKNERIRSQHLEWAISRQAVKKEQSIFEPEFVGSYQHEDNRLRNTVEEASSRSSWLTMFQPEVQEVYEERNNDYSAAIEGLVPTGARLRLGYTLREMSNILIENRRDQGLRDKDHEYRTFLGGSLTQPLLKNGGIKTTTANIRIAEADSDVAFQSYRQEMMLVVSNAAAAYWDLSLAQEKLKMRKDSVHVAEQILEDNRERFRTGKMAEIEVLEAEAGVALRRSLESEARQELVSAINDVRTLFSSSAADREITIEVADPLEMEKLEPDFKKSLHRAFKLRPEYLATRMKIDREDIRLAFAKNQRWPQLDLKASYGLNGLDDSVGGSWDEMSGDFESWSVGFELRIPLGGGMKSRSELEAAKKRKRQALLELKAVEVGLANVVDTAVGSVYSTAEQAGYYASVVDFNKRLLNVELARLEAGRSNSRLVLEKEEDLREAKEAELESLVNYIKAILGLDVASGSLLVRYGIEAMQVDL